MTVPVPLIRRPVSVGAAILNGGTDEAHASLAMTPATPVLAASAQPTPHRIRGTTTARQAKMLDPVPVPLTEAEIEQIRDWIATPPTSHVDDLIYRALRELSEIRQYEPPPQDRVDWRAMALRVKHKSAGPECSCENPKPGAHAQSCPRFGMNP